MWTVMSGPGIEAIRHHLLINSSVPTTHGLFSYTEGDWQSSVPVEAPFSLSLSGGVVG